MKYKLAICVALVFTLVVLLIPDMCVIHDSWMAKPVYKFEILRGSQP